MRRSVIISAFASLALVACETPVAAPLADLPSPRFQVENTPTGEDQFGVSAVFPSTNENNFNKSPTKWAHVLFVDVGVEQVTLDFVSNRAFISCFEYRIDDEANTVAGANPNPGILDGRWAFTCRNNSSGQLTFAAKSHVDVRLPFGAESDERFNWTRFYVLTLENKDQCKDGEWEALGFKNQGQCVRYVETGKDSRIGG